jgi:phosphatidylglycerophosphate synthase
MAMSHNTTIHRLIRPAVRMAARTHVTPNQVTTLRLATGLAAALIFAQGTYGWTVFGGLVFLLSMLLDRADGELARQLDQTSLAGHWYDVAADCIASIATFVGLGIAVSHTAGPSALWFGAFAGLGIGALFFEFHVLKIAMVEGHDLFGGRITVDPDDAMVMVPILLWCDLASLTLILAAVIAPLAAVGVGMLGFRRRAPSRPGREEKRSASGAGSYTRKT